MPPARIETVLNGPNFARDNFLTFNDGFESGDTSAWSTVEGNPTKIGGPFR